MRPADPTPFVFFNEIGIIEHLSRTAAERILPPGLSLAGFAILNHFVRLGHAERTPVQLAGAMQVTKGAMTGTLKRLEAEGWVTISPDPRDGRGKLVRLAPAGRTVREAAVRALSPLFDRLLAEISEAELAAALPTLQKVRRLLDAARDADG